MCKRCNNCKKCMLIPHLIVYHYSCTLFTAWDSAHSRIGNIVIYVLLRSDVNVVYPENIIS